METIRKSHEESQRRRGDVSVRKLTKVIMEELGTGGLVIGGLVIGGLVTGYWWIGYWWICYWWIGNW